MSEALICEDCCSKIKALLNEKLQLDDLEFNFLIRIIKKELKAIKLTLYHSFKKWERENPKRAYIAFGVSYFLTFLLGVGTSLLVWWLTS